MSISNFRFQISNLRFRISNTATEIANSASKCKLALITLKCVLPALVFAVCLSGCDSNTAPNHAAAISQPDSQPALPVVAIEQAGGVHNVFRVGENMYSGSVPEGPVGFEQLRKFGIRTILSVDGSSPDVQGARAAGMRYVHIPVGYEGIPADKQRWIARAVRDLPGPIYVHCHHGKHRGPAGAASAAVLLGTLSPAQGVQFLKLAGAADIYSGLYSCVSRLSAATKSELDAAKSDFPEKAPVQGLIATMVTIDEVNEHLLLIQKAGWKTPADHPDLVPALEAKQLKELFASVKAAGAPGQSGQRVDLQKFETLTATAGRHAAAIEAALQSANRDGKQLDAELAGLKSTCTQCHATYRDHRKF